MTQSASTIILDRQQRGARQPVGDAAMSSCGCTTSASRPASGVVPPAAAVLVSIAMSNVLRALHESRRVIYLHGAPMLDAIDVCGDRARRRREQSDHGRCLEQGRFHRDEGRSGREHDPGGPTIAKPTWRPSSRSSRSIRFVGRRPQLQSREPNAQGYFGAGDPAGPASVAPFFACPQRRLLCPALRCSWRRSRCRGRCPSPLSSDSCEPASFDRLADREPADRAVGGAVHTTSRRIPAATVDAIAGAAPHDSRRTALSVAIGVARGGALGFRAHAWVDCEGRTLIDRPRTGAYASPLESREAPRRRSPWRTTTRRTTSGGAAACATGSSCTSTRITTCGG